MSPPVPLWASNFNKIVAELSRSAGRQSRDPGGNSRSSSSLDKNTLQSELLRLTFESNRTEPPPCHRARELWLPSNSGGSTVRLEDEVRRILVVSAAFHLSGLCGANAEDVDRVIIDDLCMPLLRLGTALCMERETAAFLSSNQRQELMNYLVLASANVSCGIRHWELMQHDAPLADIDTGILAWESAARLSPASLQGLDLFGAGSPLAGQRKILTLLPLMMLRIGTEGWGGFRLEWSRFSLVSLAHLLRIVDDAAVAAGFDAEQEYRIKAAVLESLRIITRDNSSCGLLALPTHGIYLLSPLLGSQLCRDALEAQRLPSSRLTSTSSHSSSSVSDVSSSSASGFLTQRQSLLKVAYAVKAVKAVPLPHHKSIRDQDIAERSLMPLRHALFTSLASSADNTVLEWSALVRDTMLSVHTSGLTECFTMLRHIATRARRTASKEYPADPLSDRLLRSFLRVVVLRVTVLVTKQDDVYTGAKRRPSTAEASWREAMEYLRLCHRIVTGEIMMLWPDLHEADLPRSYWVLVKRLMS